MNRLKMLLAALVLAALVAPAWAATRTVTLSVQGMTCAACTITVKKALTKVEGVIHVQVSFDEREAVITYDDARTSIPALEEATANAGYPASPKK